MSWKTLRHARGHAAAIPKLVKQLASDDTRARDEAHSKLADALVGDGAWYSASAPAVSLLLDSLPQATEPERQLVLVADVIGADHLRCWLEPPNKRTPPKAKACHEAALEQRDVLLAALRAKQPMVRATAAVTLCMIPRLHDEALPLLEKMAAKDKQPVARASALLALARLGSCGDALLVAAAKHKHALLRGTAALAAVRLGSAKRFSDVSEGLEAWLGYELPAGHRLPWFGAWSQVWVDGMPFIDGPGRVLVALAHAGGRKASDDLVEVVLSIGAGSDQGRIETQVGKVLLVLGDFPPKEVVKKDIPVVLAKTLTKPQRAMAMKLAATSLVPAGDYGLPASGEARKRWLGLSPAGPLDQLVKGRGSKKLPLWRSWQLGNTHYPPKGPLAGLDLWQALVEYVAQTYGTTRVVLPNAVEEVLVAAQPHDALLDRAGRLADELAERYAAAERGGTRIVPQFGSSALLLLPLVRAGHKLEPRWQSLIYVGPEPQAREILGAFPKKQRDQLLRRYLDTDKAVWARVKAVLAVADLSPTKPLGRLIEQKLTQLKEAGLNRRDLANLRGRLRSLTKKHPSLGA